jgi:hypothetical protein
MNEVLAQLMANAPAVPEDFEPKVDPPPKLDTDAILALASNPQEEKFIKEAIFAGSANFRGSEKYQHPIELNVKVNNLLKAYAEKLDKYKCACRLARIYQWPYVYAKNVIEYCEANIIPESSKPDPEDKVKTEYNKPSLRIKLV